jgi:hypothetical protein
MAFTQTDLDAVDTAIASGALTVRHADGRMVTYREMGELLKARDLIASALAAATSGAGSSRLYPRHQLANFAD